MALNPHALLWKLPAWVWVVSFAFFLTLALIVDAPDNLPEPTEFDEFFHPPIIVARSGKSFRFVPYGRHQGIKPLWAIIYVSESHPRVEWRLGWGDGRLNLGIWKRSAHWKYVLVSERCDSEPKNTRIGPRSLPIEDMQQILPMLITELNERAPEQERGTRLKELLDSGIERSTFLCPQNVVILLAWVSLLPAIAAVVTMFTNPAACGLAHAESSK